MKNQLSANQEGNVALIVAIVIACVGIIIGVALWQDHTNSLGYQYRNCVETSDNGENIGFNCGQRAYFVPSSERKQVFKDLAPDDQQGGPAAFTDDNAPNN